MNRVRYCVPLQKKIVVPDNVEAFLDEYAALRAKYGFALSMDHEDNELILDPHNDEWDALEDASIAIAYTDTEQLPEEKWLHLPRASDTCEAFMRYMEYKRNFAPVGTAGEMLDFRQWCAHRNSRAYWLLTPHINAGVQPPGA